MCRLGTLAGQGLGMSCGCGLVAERPRRLAVLTVVEETTGIPFRDLEAGGTRGVEAVDQHGAISVGKVSPSWFDSRKLRPGGTSPPPQSLPALGQNPGLPASIPGSLQGTSFRILKIPRCSGPHGLQEECVCCAFFCAHVPGAS